MNFISNSLFIAEQIIVCEGELANITCPDNKFIIVLLANYGRFTLSQCNPAHDTELSVTCHNDKTLGILQSRLNFLLR
ncbi:unnamed protein product [Dracunculus medinensis]|uniref:SUEL-type lectin domain-containing protein n=1 Tax=Dracunculus medinensis TaxID=318479 RepID=A0A0N4UHR8_DRAME|nr:unnamed protein product [Dracunculus medinensis]